MRYSQYCSDVTEVTSEYNALIIVNTKLQALKKIDNKAWVKDEYYWPIIAQQMMTGNL